MRLTALTLLFRMYCIPAWYRMVMRSQIYTRFGWEKTDSYGRPVARAALAQSVEKK